MKREFKYREKAQVDAEVQMYAPGGHPHFVALSIAHESAFSIKDGVCTVHADNRNKKTLIQSADARQPSGVAATDNSSRN